MTTCVQSHGRGTKLAKEYARKELMEQERGTEKRGMMGGRLAKEMTGAEKEARNAPRVVSSEKTTDTVAEGEIERQVQGQY